jgi:hypothetical protein
VSHYPTLCCSCTRLHLVKFSVQSIEIEACKIEQAIRQHLPLDRTFRLNYIKSCKNIKDKREKVEDLYVNIKPAPIADIDYLLEDPGVDTQLDSDLSG